MSIRRLESISTRMLHAFQNTRSVVQGDEMVRSRRSTRPQGRRPPRAWSGRAAIALLVFPILSCRGATAPKHTADHKIASAESTLPAAASTTTTPASASTPAASTPAPTGRSGQLDRIDHVTIDPHPRCGPAYDEHGQPEREAWLQSPDIQRGVAILNAVLEDYKQASLGTVLDNEHKAVVVVFHADFHDYDLIQKRLIGRIAPLEVVLQPSCYSRAKLAEVERALLEGSWHPEAAKTRKGFWLDPSFSGYRVTIDDSAPEVGSALAKRFDELVRVTLGKPRRN